MFLISLIHGSEVLREEWQDLRFETHSHPVGVIAVVDLKRGRNI